MKRTEFYLKLNVKAYEWNGLELEKIFHEAIKKEIGRDLSFPEEDIVITPIEFYEVERSETLGK